MNDYSEGGARLTFNGEIRLPNRFRLCFDGFTLPIHCAVRHESKGHVGVEFVMARRHSLDQTVQELLGWLAR